jgi:hypothetical protein
MCWDRVVEAEQSSPREQPRPQADPLIVRRTPMWRRERAGVEHRLPLDMPHGEAALGFSN